MFWAKKNETQARLNSLQKQIDRVEQRLTCDHKSVIFSAAYWVAPPRFVQRCTNCGKILSVYKTEKEMLTAKAFHLTQESKRILDGIKEE